MTEQRPDPERTAARRRLLDVLLDAPGDAARVADLADRADWRMPRGVAAVAIGGPPHPAALPPDALPGAHRRVPCVLLPDRHGGEAALRDALRGRRAVLGPAVRTADAAVSLRWAREALALTDRARPAGLVHATEMLPPFAVFRDEELVHAVAAHWLAPLDRLPPGDGVTVARLMRAHLRGGVPPHADRALTYRARALLGGARPAAGHRLDLLILLQAWLGRCVRERPRTSRIG